MDVIELFYTNRDKGCQKAFQMLSGLAKKRALLFMAYDVDTTAGMTIAIKRRVQGVPLTIINNKKVLKGAPFSEQQILDNIGK